MMCWIPRVVSTVLLALVAGCSLLPGGDPPSGPAASEADGGDDTTTLGDPELATGERDGGVPAPIETPPTPDAGVPSIAPTTQWTGTVPFTSSVPFGRDICRFSARFEDVVVKLTLREDKIAAATITAKDVEKLHGGCVYDPKPTPRAPEGHTWSLPMTDATAPRVVIRGDDKGLSELMIEVGLDSESTGWASLRFRRLDIDAPYNWTVGPQWITLTKQ